METLESLRGKIQSVKQLQSLVHTMKTMAAVNIRQYEKAVRSLSAYNHHIELGFQIILADAPSGIAVTQELETHQAGVIVFGSDQGMVGQFNRVIARYARQVISDAQIPPEGRRVLAVGIRAAARLQQAGQLVEDVINVPGSLAGVQAVVDDLILRVESWRVNQQIDRIMIIYNTPMSGSSYEPHHVMLIPIDPHWFEGLKNREWQSRRIPTYFVDWDTLFSALIREYFFVSLYRAAAESQAAENASRLAAMQAAEKNVEEQANELNAKYQQLRQTKITEELLDVIAGFETITNR